MEVSKILKEIKDSVLAIEPSAEIILFGSEARGTAGKESDIDLLILTSKKLDFNQKMNISGAVFQIELKYTKVISPFIMSNDEWQDQRTKTTFYHEVTREGIKL